jgi:hypothetical protein
LYGCQDIGKQLANEKADASASKGSAKAFTGPEPVFVISKEQPYVHFCVDQITTPDTLDQRGRSESKLMMGKPSHNRWLLVFCD